MNASLDHEAWAALTMVVRDRLLAGHPLEGDGSASPRALAARSAVRTAIPPSTTFFAEPGRPLVLRLELDGRGRSWDAPHTAESHAFVEEVDQHGTVSRADPGGDIVWFAPDGTDAMGWHLENALAHSLSLRVEDELKRRRDRLEAILDAVGWREFGLPVPDGTPDPRMRSVARLREGPRELSSRDLVEDMRGLRVLTLVPREVEDVAQTARLLYVRGWNQWELLTQASRESVAALEVALSHLDTALRGRPSRASLVQLIDAMGSTTAGALLSEWDRRRAHALRMSRNQMVHPVDGPPLQWISWARSDVAEAVTLINLMWARKHELIPRDLGWEVHALG